MEKRKEFIFAFPQDVVSAGSYGLCGHCEEYPDATADINAVRICRSCKAEKFPEVEIGFIDSDAVFRCRAESCEATSLSYREYIVGSCCEVAMRSFYCKSDKYADLCTVHKIFKESTNEVHLAECDLKKADDETEKAYTAYQNAKKKREAAEEKLQRSRKWRQKTQQRLVFVTIPAIKEDNSDLDETDSSSSDEDSENEPPEKKKKEENEKHQCGICFELYDDDHREGVLISCRHKFCFDCLTTGWKRPEKKCPKCQQEFTVEQDIKDIALNIELS